MNRVPLSDAPTDTSVHLALHPEHPSAVIATVSGPSTHTARAILSMLAFRPVDERTMLLARIDHEEPYYANLAAGLLRQEQATVHIAPELQKEIDTDWTWADYPMPWLDRDEIRLASAEAQQIHDDIQSGRLVIHLHAPDGHTIVAAGTYQHADSVHLHGEDHLRVVSSSYDTPSEAITEFERLYGAAVRTGLPPATDTEQQTAQATATVITGAPAFASEAPLEPPVPKTESVAVHAADPGDHESLLDNFLEAHGDWERYRTWDDDSTVANHESLTLRALFDHEAQGRDTKWMLAAYETPVSERLWSTTATASTPAEIVLAMLNSAASESAWGPAAGLTETTITQATRPLADAGWKQSVEGRYIRWDVPGEEAAGIQFDAFAAGQRPGSLLPTWTVWGGNAIHQPTWALELSAHFPTPLLQDIAFELAEGQGARAIQPVPPGGPVLRTAQADATVSPPAPLHPGRRR